MKRATWLGIGSAGFVAIVIGAAIALPLLSSCRPAGKPIAAERKIRQAAVADMFYPGNPGELDRTVNDYLAVANSKAVKNLRALICPHAGYQFSGPIAACSYKLLVGREIQTIILMGPSHYAVFKGAYIPAVENYQTPLGNVPLALLAKTLAKQAPFSSHLECQVQRPAWWRQARIEVPPFGQDLPDTWEHSLEVQLPFIHKTAPKAKIVPIIFGEVEPEQVARALAPHVDEKTLVVVSTDLSHYMPYETAKHLDNLCISAALALNIERMKTQEACGRGPVLALMHLAKLKGWSASLLNYRNSGDTAGDKSKVVGYAAIAMYQGDAPATAPSPITQPALQEHSAAERMFLLDLARATLNEAVVNRRVAAVDLQKMSPRLAEHRGCFVTLTRKGQLRGCIGLIPPEKPLYQAVIENTIHAALHDARFNPVGKDELGEIEIEISVLTVARPLQFDSPQDLLAKLRPGKDGVVLRIGARQATYLPQVWQQIPDKEQFLSQLAEKAGLSADAWRGAGVVVEVYEDEAFGERPVDSRP